MNSNKNYMILTDANFQKEVLDAQKRNFSIVQNAGQVDREGIF